MNSDARPLTAGHSMTKTRISLYADHPRTYRENKFVYPVLSRRSKGISIGVNLNPDKICNFDCIYCQVNRRSESETKFVETDRLMDELDWMLSFVTSGDIYHDEQFQDIPEPLRRLNDIAFSGDGEPTTFRNIDTIVESVAALKIRHRLHKTKLVLITNASMFHRPVVKRTLEILDDNNGEVWAKLETGTEEYYQLVERTKIPFRQILDNIAEAAQKRPIVIQSLFMKIHDNSPPKSEIDAFCDRLNEITESGGRIQLVQVYTVARPPTEGFVAALSPHEVNGIATVVNHRTGLPTDVYDS